VDGQDFADIEAYGVERWLGELRPLGISTVRDRVCMTAAMLVLEPIFEADFPSEIYAYRAGRNA
jgi:RNA-directed DNA polymerase